MTTPIDDQPLESLVPPSSSPDDPELGSLAQAARRKQLGFARWALLIIGAITLAFQIGMGFFAEGMVNRDLEAEIRAAEAEGYDIDPVALAEFRQTAIRAVQVSCAIWAGVGVAFIAFGVFVYRYPVPLTIAGLLLYIGSIAVEAAIAPETLFKGWLVRILIIAGLFKSVQAAIASERETKRQVRPAEPSLA